MPTVFATPGGTPPTEFRSFLPSRKKNLKNFVCRFFFGGEGFSSATGLGFNMGAKFPADLLTSLTGGVRRRGQKQHRCPLPNYDCIRGMRS